MTDTEQELLDAEHDDLCPTCQGAGELVECPPKCDGSHRADLTWRCTDCNGTGERS